MEDQNKEAVGSARGTLSKLGSQIEELKALSRSPEQINKEAEAAVALVRRTHALALAEDLSALGLSGGDVETMIALTRNEPLHLEPKLCETIISNRKELEKQLREEPLPSPSRSDWSVEAEHICQDLADSTMFDRSKSNNKHAGELQDTIVRVIGAVRRLGDGAEMERIKIEEELENCKKQLGAVTNFSSMQETLLGEALRLLDGLRECGHLTDEAAKWVQLALQDTNIKGITNDLP